MLTNPLRFSITEMLLLDRFKSRS